MNTHALSAIIGCLALLAAELHAGEVRYVGKTKYLNQAQAVVTHSIDDSTKHVPAPIDAMDKYGIKSTILDRAHREKAGIASSRRPNSYD